MRLADRLFQIAQIPRRRRLTTAGPIAERLEVAERTVYRDIRDLSLAGVPVLGEAGVGYSLGGDFHLQLPPRPHRGSIVPRRDVRERISHGPGGFHPGP